jgi:hypothetical protein
MEKRSQCWHADAQISSGFSQIENGLAFLFHIFHSFLLRLTQLSHIIIPITFL